MQADEPAVVDILADGPVQPVIRFATARRSRTIYSTARNAYVAFVGNRQGNTVHDAPQIMNVTLYNSGPVMAGAAVWYCGAVPRAQEP